MVEVNPMKKVVLLVVGLVILSGIVAAIPHKNEVRAVNTFGLVGHSNTAWVRKYGDHQIVFVRGTHYEMGYQHGAMLADEVYKTLYAYLNAVDESEEELLQVYANGEPYLPQEYKDEMQGLADGAQIDIDLIHAAHTIPTLHHCSGFAVWGNATVDGKVYHTRSLDYGVTIADPDTGETIQMFSEVIVRKPNNGYTSMIPAWAGFIGSVDGMNEKKISIGEMGQGTDDHTQHGLFMIFRLRYTLEKASNMDEAIYYMGINRTYGYSFIVADGNTNTAQMLEMTWHHYYNGTWNDVEEANGYSEMQYQIPFAVRRGNHMIAYETAMTQRDLYNLPPTDGDFLHLINYLEHSKRIEREYGNIDFDKAQEIFTEAYRRYPLQFTLHQVVFDPADLKMRVADAYPEGTGAFWNTFYEYSLPDILSMPEILNISNPTNGSSVSGVVTITPTLLTGYVPDVVRFYIDGVEVGNTTTPPYTFNWDSSTVANGQHVVEVRAFGENFSAVAYVTVYVNNLISNPKPLVIHYRTFEINPNPITIRDIVKNLHLPEIKSEVKKTRADWIINTTLYLNDTTKYVDGNVIVTNGGSLIMNNATLVINSTYDGEFGIIVNNGSSLIVRNSNITNGSARIYIYVNSSAKKVIVENSEISGGGYSLEKSLMYIACDNISVENSKFIHNGYGLIINGMNTLSNVSVRNVSFYIRDILHLPVADIFTPRGTSLLLGNTANATAENIDIHGIDNGKLLSFGVLLVASKNALVRNVFVEHEYVGIGFLNSQDNYAENITVIYSHIGGGFLIGSQHNEINGLRMEHGAGGIAVAYNAPYNTVRNCYINDTSIAIGAEESEGIMYENITVENSLGGSLFEKAQNIIIRNATIKSEYAGIIFKKACDNAIVENVKMYISRDMYGMGIRKSPGVVLKNVEIHGVRYAVHIEGDELQHYKITVNNVTTDFGNVEYCYGSVPSDLTGGEIIIANVSNVNINITSAKSPIYLAYVSHSSVSIQSSDAVSGIMIYHSNSIDVYGSVKNSSTYGVMLYDVHTSNINVDVDGACWAYALHHSDGIFINGIVNNIKDSSIYSVYSTFTADINATESNYGLIGSFSTMFILRNIPQAKYYYVVYNSTVYLCNYLHVYVLDASDNPIEGAIVNISFNGVLVYSSTTDANGYAVFAAPYATWSPESGEVFNLTKIEVYYNSLNFSDNPRYVDMRSERTEIFRESTVNEFWPVFLVTILFAAIYLAIIRKTH